MKSQKQEIIGKYYHNNNLKEYFEYVFLYCSLLLNRKDSRDLWPKTNYWLLAPDRNNQIAYNQKLQ